MRKQGNLMENLKILSEGDTKDPVRNLWRNVLIVAIEDLIKLTTITVRFSIVNKKQKEALEYFSIPNEDFDEVCQLAGFDVEYVRGKVLKAIKKLQIKESEYGKSYMPEMQRERIQPSSY